MARKLPKEDVLSVIDTLQQSTTFLPTPSLKKERWLPICLTFGSCGKLKYSLWDKDPDDKDFCRLQEGPVTKGQTTNYEEWSIILINRLMVNRDFHY